MISAKLPHVLYGGDYNPEQWPEEVWREDVLLMRDAGVNLVTLAVFSWAEIERRPGEYDFGWLDRIMNLLAENEIYVDLATATASPPPWMAKLYPESLPQDAEGRRYRPGSRQQYCPNSVMYRKYAAELTRRLA
ncbi:MAG: beta-galactosidase, partial [Planctomycetota bacterium]|nr:beta-galactosidase [Planctomycetota bacterium]